MNKEAIEHRNRLKILENTMGTTFYETGHLHLAISDAMEEYHQAKIKLLDIPDVVKSSHCELYDFGRQDKTCEKKCDSCKWMEEQ